MRHQQPRNAPPVAFLRRVVQGFFVTLSGAAAMENGSMSKPRPPSLLPPQKHVHPHRASPCGFLQVPQSFPLENEGWGCGALGMIEVGESVPQFAPSCRRGIATIAALIRRKRNRRFSYGLPNRARVEVVNAPIGPAFYPPTSRSSDVTPLTASSMARHPGSG